MDERDWYEVTEGQSLFQGDILMNCPVFTVVGALQWPLPADTEVEVEAKIFDLVVLTQSCDLENEKIEDLLLAQLVSWADAVRAEVARGNEVVRSRKFRRLAARRQSLRARRGECVAPFQQPSWALVCTIRAGSGAHGSTGVDV
jgi:hypothetical protein